VSQLDPQRIWFISGGGAIANFPVGSRLNLTDLKTLEVIENVSTRLIGLPAASFDMVPAYTPTESGQSSMPLPTQTLEAKVETEIEAIPYGTSIGRQTTVSESYSRTKPQSEQVKYPYVQGRGIQEAVLACLQMVSQYFGMPFKKDVIRKILQRNIGQTGEVSLQLCASVSEFMGLRAQLVSIPRDSFDRLQTPFLINWQDSIAVVYEISDRSVILAVPETGIVTQRSTDFMSNLGSEPTQVLMLQRTSETPQQKFGLKWFLPSLSKYRRGLFEVLIASFFVQLFGLANPLMIQIIIDKVLVQNSIDTLQVLGILLLVVALFEAVLTALRTYLFAEITNRIDLALGAEIIDHLLRLPLRYFDRRPVGELSTRVNELENIRQFLTGTALTVVLDSVFSIIYIVVMFFYSALLAIVALITIPLFALLTFVVAPIVRGQLRVKAERNAQTQSLLVEVLSGIQTVKAQNIELRSRWQWQERYAKYVSSGFQTVLTFTAASSISGFLNQLSGLLVLCVGAYLVLKQELTLGQLIAFRIISGYVTSPLLRLVQLWQTFQETALSLERLADIVDTPQEADEIDRQNIPMPTIQGQVIYEDLSFRFGTSGAMQLNSINLEIPAGQFIGVVGQSGSGKSTMMKLLPRLYAPNGGRILIDGYDISKVELYSLRSQVGIIPQDTLLFDGTVQENICLTRPEATSEEIVEAARLAVAHEFIMSLPSGYNSRVGERGSSLSGGQRQRIAIARTILQNPNMLILDEATSALDYDTERNVCLNLTQAFAGRTVFFITHRLGTVQHADRIIVMDKGNIAEQGTHAELMALRGRYFCLYKQQDAEVI
jgi:ATP-binding cassette, subfamily B, bacterial HlyB/CyaB